MKKKDVILTDVLKILEKRGSIKDHKKILSYNFIHNSHIDSLSLIKFILELENKFKIKFKEKEINSNQFKIIGSLIKIIRKKIKNK